MCRLAKGKIGGGGGGGGADGEDESASFTKEQPHQSAVKMEQLYQAW